MRDFSIQESSSQCDKEKDIRVLLFVQEGRAKQKYLEALLDCGVQVFVTSSFLDLSKEICNQTYHGLFLDMPTKMKAIKENKAYVYHLVEKFPVSHLQADDETGEIRCFHFNQKSGRTLLDFINSQCRNFVPQKIRTDARVEIHLPVLVYRHLADKRPERSATKDVSPGGCFIFSSRRRKSGEAIWLRFKGISDPQPIVAQIQTVIQWGQARQIPGIGLKFKDLSPQQAAGLAEVCRPDDHLRVIED